ncbi:MAG: hypothetical protein KZQ66_18555 [Candidatus Thiodiazotropha sp. (ex Lucinoma aequizonata)]|nr:hypothetical protein [Candidatus Thiodiazotropha sp. (ex Lucinoma aequizonata)]
MGPVEWHRCPARLSAIMGRSLCAWGFHWAKIYRVCRICRSPALHSNP